MWNILFPCQILLVQHSDCGAALTPAGQRQIIIRQRLRGIEHRQHKARLVQLFPAAADTLGLDGIPVRADLAHTGGVKQIQPHAAEYDAHRTAYLQSIGCRVLRYGNNELDTNFAGVCEDILQKIG